MVQQYDEDSDGVLNEDEFAQIKAQVIAQRQQQ